ncbi:hypothetical protein ACFL1S_09210, partial [Pseudomonadota bacterium]
HQDNGSVGPTTHVQGSEILTAMLEGLQCAYDYLQYWFITDGGGLRCANFLFSIHFYGGPCRDRTCDHLIKSQIPNS